MIGRTVVAFVFVPIFGYPAVCFASPVAWILADCFLVSGLLFLCAHLEKRAALEDRQAVLEEKQEIKIEKILMIATAVRLRLKEQQTGWHRN